MKVKKYVAPTMPEAMNKIRKELGHDAVILNSKEINQGGFLGFFRKKNIEVIAAIDPQPKVEQKASPKKPERQEKPIQPSVPKAPPISYAQQDEPKPKQDENVLKEIRELKELMQHQPMSSTVAYPDVLQEVYQNLIKQEVSEEISHQLMQPLIETFYTTKSNVNEEMVKEWLIDEIRHQVQDIPFEGLSFEKQFIHLVGPTGVGKTTTIAKLAAESVIKHKKKVAFITTDTFRIAAIDQLKTYAKILDIPIEIAYNLEDYKQAKEKFSDYDHVLVDTAGRNFRDQQYVEELKKIIDFEAELETYLALSLTSKYSDMDAIYQQFSNVPIQKLIFTKVDETSYSGAMLNMVLQHKIGVAYLTDGQNVPDDISEASVEKMIRRIVGETGET
ncbi:flagellar biosynthesis protein FlhF [Pontibacillus marinus]|uniref:Flagellar biosynthesis protein FlhF n=1 Tax=Pontibacillus marinus BH030004 = DSM 16465 TaxID=1385511 RepID=A0A0A5G671_9BACI|nr:flagellar biosynthesis protein FlhF [Pontibacillus marinus]KGX88621.1 flagellar biosynthesis regulator FlhF [Pontibacillus marinus BH030004 = DSM 16465]